MNKKIYIILGAPGAGKGTRSELIREKLNIPHISTGSVIRENKEVIAKYNQSVNSGKLIPDYVIEYLLEKELDKQDTSKGYILDGYPRNIEQSEILEKILEGRKEKITKVFLFEATLETIYYRILSRKICSKCSKIYGHSDDVAEGDKCPICSGKIILRKDDNERTLKNRVDVFFKEIENIKKYYSERKLLEIVDANEDPKDILNKI